MIDAVALKEFFDSIPKQIVPFTDCEIRQNGKTIFRYGQGFSDYAHSRPVSATDLYWMYSCSKVVTAVAAMRLIEQGKLGLYDLVETYIPEFSDVTVLQSKDTLVYDPVKADFVGVASGAALETAPAKNKMRIYDLLRMASGLSYDMTVPQVQCFKENPSLGTLDFARLQAQVPLKFEPGTDFLYSFSHDVLAAVIEIVTGMGFDTYLQKEIFDPLGMEHTGFSPKEDDTYRLAAQYMMDDDGVTFHDIGKGNEYALNSSTKSGGAGLVSTLDDMMRFCDVLANGGTTADGYCLLTKNSIDLMRQSHFNDIQKESLHTLWPHLQNYSYGLGVRTFEENRDGNGGEPGEFGWEGAAGSLLLIDPNKRISCVYTQHVRKCPLAPNYIHRHIIRAIYAAE